jgi:hypothetical protein
MKRLRDEGLSEDARLAAAADLMRGASFEDPTALLKQRVRARLLAANRSSGAMQLRLGFVVVLLLGLASLAGATAMKLWRRPPAAKPAAAGGREPELFRARHTVPLTAAPATDAIDPPRATKIVPAAKRPREVATLAPARSARPPAVAVDLPETGQTAAPPAAAPPVAATPGRVSAPEAILLAEATRKLYVEGNAQRAAELVDEYRRRFANGDLLEECLALAIRARSSLGDRRAAALADEYLQRFPAGRFRVEALQSQREFAK